MTQSIQFGTEGDDAIDVVGNVVLTYIGLAGNDTYMLANGLGPIQLVEQAGGGIDTVITSVNAPILLPDFIENLILNGAAHQGAGNALDNRIVGSAIGDLLDGGAGNDTMLGGNGDDIYIVDATLDRIEELAGPDTGDDLVRASVSFVLPANVERGEVTAAGRIDVTGNASDNTIDGGSGVNLLSGLAGNDTMTGGDGNDTLLGGGGADLLHGEVGNDLVDGGNGNDDLLGGPGNDTLLGGAGNDSLRGGTGINTLTGGAGNDTYYISLATLGFDTIVEAVGGGVDTLVTDALSALPANVENMTWIGAGGFTLSGNALNNRIVAQGNGAGPANNLIEGRAGNDWLDGREGADTMVGGAGNDVMVVDDSGDVVVEKANEGADLVYTSLLDTTLSSNVENLTLLAGTAARIGRGNALANIITGNDADNYLTGGGGNDRLIGNGGADTLAGGAGDDTYVITDPTDGGIVIARVLENGEAGSGNDLIQLDQQADRFTMPDNVEQLVAMNVASITGNRSANRIESGSGDNHIDGGSGADTMIGGAGNDYYRVDAAGDVVVELANGGAFDSIETKVTFTLPDNVENLNLAPGVGAIGGTGNGLANTISGNASANVLSGLGGDDQLFGDRGNDELLGGAGNDTLDGGAGNDTMRGGTGDDQYTVDAVGDVVDEGANGGNDTITSSVTIDLQTMPNVESVTLTGVRALNATGNALGNVLHGNAGNNLLIGLGGNDLLDGDFGSDTLIGGAGNDTYVVGYPGEEPADTLVEAANEGTDTVISLSSWTLDTNFENLVLHPASSVDTDGTGNSANNRLEGNNRNNLLDGLQGRDTMIGGGGNDTYVVDNVGDVVTESADKGTDQIILNNAAQAANYLLPANVENVAVITGTNSRVTGNALDNVIEGGIGNDVFDGGAGNDTLVGAGGNDTLTGGRGNDSIDGGSGNDLMTGGAGDDTFVVDSGDGALSLVSGPEDRVMEAAGGGTDLVILTTGSGGYGLPDQVENLDVTVAINGGFALLGNALANEIHLTSVALLNLDVGAGDDTVDLGQVVNGAPSTQLTLQGGAGQDSLRFAIGGTVTGTLIMTGFESARIDSGGGGTFTGTASTDLAELTVVGGGDLTLSGSLSTRYVMDGYAGTLSLLNIAGTNGANDTVNLRVVDSISASIGGLAGVERVIIDSASAMGGVTNLLSVFPLAAPEGRLLVAGGAAPLLLDGLVDGAVVLLSGYTSNAFDFSMDNPAGNNHVTIGVDGFNGAINTDFANGHDELTLSTGSAGVPNAPSVVTLSGLFSDDRLVLTGAGTLDISQVVAQDIVVNDYTGTLLFQADAFGQPITVNVVDASQGALNIVGTIGNDTFNMGSTLDSSDSIAGQAGSDTLTANITGLQAGTTGRLQINGVENMTFSIDAGASNTSIDMDGSLNLGAIVTGGAGVLSVLDVQNASGDWDFGSFNGKLTVEARGDVALHATGTANADTFTGHHGDDSFNGGGGNDTLSGGQGNDMLTGGAGNDVFVLGDSLPSGGSPNGPDVDTIADFQAGDSIRLLGDYPFGLFNQLEAGALAAGAFRSGTGATTAVDADDRIIYNTTNGNLYYDADGTGAGAAVQIATLTGNPILMATDFTVT